MSTFKLQLNNFSLKQKKRGEGKLLRFTLSWRLDTPNPNPELPGEPFKLGVSLNGCLAYVSIVTGELYWHPPQQKAGYKWIHLMTVTADMYEEVRQLILHSPYYVELAPPAHKIWNNNAELNDLGNRAYEPVQFEQEYLNE